MLLRYAMCSLPASASLAGVASASAARRRFLSTLSSVALAYLNPSAKKAAREKENEEVEDKEPLPDMRPPPRPVSANPQAVLVY